MLGLLINIMITFVGIGIMTVVVYYYLPVIEKTLEEKLKISLFRNSKNRENQPLTQVFYKFNHNSAKDWAAWINGQDEVTQEKAFAQIISHLQEAPSEWGAITVEAIWGISQFSYPEAFEVLTDFMDSARRMWKKYKILGSCYEQACKSLIIINSDDAKETLMKELEKPTKDNDEIGISIIEAIVTFPEEVNINDMFVQLLTDKNQPLSTKQYAINAAQKRNQENAQQIAKEAVEVYIDRTDANLLIDEVKIFQSLLNFATATITEEIFDLILSACSAEHVARAAIQTVSEIVSNKNVEFTTDQLHTLYKLEHEDQHKIELALAKRSGLNQQELGLVKGSSVLKRYPFKKGSLTCETLTYEIQLPSDLETLYSEIKECLAPRQVQNEKGDMVQGGGVMLGGVAEKEKFYISRAVAAQRKWAFVFGIHEDLVTSNHFVKELIDTIQVSKPCLVYIEDIAKALNNPSDPVLYALKPFIPDPMVFFITTLKKDLGMSEGASELPLFLKNLPRDLLPIVKEITSCSDKQKEKIIAENLSKLSDKRGSISLEELLKPTDGMSSFEFGDFMLEYFKTVLLVHGQLIPMPEFEGLQGK
jgi:hypothetical protein